MTRGSQAPEAAISQNTQDEVRLRAQISASRMTLVTRWTLIVIKDTRFREKRAAADASAPSRLKEQNSGNNPHHSSISVLSMGTFGHQVGA
jgi:hypothetical protein